MATPASQPASRAGKPPAAPPAGKSGGSNIIRQHPVITLGVIAGATALGWLWLRRRRAAAAGQATASTTTSTAATADTTEQLGEIEQELQELLSQGGTGGGGGGGGGTTTTKTSTTTKTTTKTKPSHAPTGESAGGVTDSQAILRWTSVAAATSYQVRVWEATRAHPVIHDQSAATTAQAVTGLKPGTRYGWHVAAVNSAGQGPWSANQHFQTKAGPAVHPGGTITGPPPA
jgi:hypothetical protein